MELPALLVFLQAGSLLDAELAPQLLDQVNDAVTAGATAVVLDGSDSAAALYEAAVKLKELLRERAALLLLDRLDIAAAVGAEGVVLSPTGVPVVVARKMQQGPLLLGQMVSSAEAAVAAAADGASFVLLQGADGGLPQASDLTAARSQQRSGNAIPVIAAAGASCSPASLQQQLPSLAAPADGFCMPLQLLQPAAAAADAAAAATASADSAATSAAVGVLLQALTEGHTPEAAAAAVGDSSSADWSGSSSSSSSGAAAAAAPPSGSATTVKVPAGGSALRRLLNASKESMIAEERKLLQQVAALLEEVAPQMDELPLLRDAITNLDDVFLVVVVGEFNSGKSTVINALLGEKFLADGILPTTNEISVLKYADPASPKQQPELVQQSDGLFVRRLPAALLREMNIVDTPGTNVILERQQRLTEEYVPRADLVLFVLSADRPLSESELAFLKYIRQWRKKVVFVVNKVDMLDSEEEVSQVLSFVSSNASKLLQLDSPAVLPISGRAALKAKLGCGSGQSGGVLDSWEDELLSSQPGWQKSRFGEFEKFIYDFLVGSAGSSSSSMRSGGEGLRLKLQTPLFVADALMEAARVRLQGEIAAAEGELAALGAVRRQLAKFKVEMSKDAEAQRQVCISLVGEAISRNNKYVDKTLQLSNLPALTGYLFGSSKGAAGMPVASSSWEAEVVSGTFDQLAKQVAEHAAWLATNCSNQLDYYASYLQQHRMPGSSSSSSSNSKQQQATSSSSNGSSPPETAGSGSSAALASSDAAAAAMAAAAAGSRSLAAVADFKPDAARMLLEEELREAFLGTAGSAAGAQGLGLLAASWLKGGLEDLLALTVAGLASYVAVLNLPLKRADIKGKVARVAGNFADSVTTAMAEESDTAVEATTSQVLQQVAPLEAAWQAQLQQLQASEARRAQLAEALQVMEKRTANLQ
ncbi:hypothetical protein OEZ85_013792 [Tetradesmus obliquus]|uniref:G domain-containing protein n=1 Tax=Tetradesmus obliquus TaxID=3088 RepID=A0ABY8U9W6_TETOB|nr:hypothetical protein OEZ85_013792 [Tetradesmus obliquus]